MEDGGVERREGPTAGELMRAIDRLSGELRDLRTHVDTRLDAVAGGAVPASAYVERNRATEESLQRLTLALADEKAARERADQELKDTAEREQEKRAVTVRYLLAGIVVAVGTSLVDLLRGTGVAG